MKNGLVVEDCNKRWYLNDELHRVDGPAVESADGSKFWYLHGKKHRVDGPAWEFAYGIMRWFLNDEVLIHPESFKTMESWFKYLNANEEQTYQLIHDHKGFIGFIKNPSAKQIRVHQMAHLL